MKEISLMFSEKVDKVQSGDDLLPEAENGGSFCGCQEKASTRR